MNPMVRARMRRIATIAISIKSGQEPVLFCKGIA
jgi:hypothetical protein